MKKASKNTPVLQSRVAGKNAGPNPMEQQLALNLYLNGSYAQAEQYTRTLTTQYPKHGFGWKLLGAALIQQGLVQEALPVLARATQLMPMDAEAHNNLGCAYQDSGQLELARASYLRALAFKPDHLDVLTNLAETLRLLGKGSEALTYLNRKLRLTPDDTVTRHTIDVLTGTNPERPPAEYVSRLFDHHAASFDSHLTGMLGYAVPEQLVELLVRHAPTPLENKKVLDLGCGTGLIGQALAAMHCDIVGVDLSSKMLDKARAKNLYSELICEDIVAMMQGQAEQSYDIVTSADVFIYLGKLDTVMAQSKRLLRTGGILAFSIETLVPNAAEATDTESRFCLTETGRYSHTLAYLDALANEHGFHPLAQEATTIRTEGSVPVPGCLILWSR